MIAIDEYSREHELFRKLRPFLAVVQSNITTKRIAWMPVLKEHRNGWVDQPRRMTFEEFVRDYLKCGERLQ
jgi:hypothetical protein